MKQTATIILLAAVVLLKSGVLSAQTYFEDRKDIPQEYKWSLTDLYANWGDWEKDLNLLEKQMDEIANLKGTLKNGASSFLKANQLQDALGILAEKVYRYASLNFDINTKDQIASANLQKVRVLYSKYGTATAWINPEMLEISLPTIQKWIAENKELEKYRFGIEDLYRLQAHVYTEDKETLLSYFGQFAGTPNSIYTSLSTADINFPKVTLSDGTELAATSGNYSKTLRTNRNQEDRKTIFEAHYKTYEQNKNTYASIYNAICQKDWANTQARNYKSCLEAKLETNNIPVAVYENLINTAKQNTAPLQRYLKLRAKVLGLKEYHNYDGSIPLIEFNKTYPYEEAKELVLQSVAPLGKEYQDRVRKALKSGWIDVFENAGKRTGAYSGDAYSVHPFMMLNYNETMNYVFTLAHEIGHTIHTMLANETQPYATAGYTLFVAEVASTFNERLLLDYMLEKTQDPKERAALIMQAIENINGTFYFQSQLADFELQVHKLVENGEPITADLLSKIMSDLYKTYEGDAVVQDELFNTVWARISHFYTVPFYVYQYATCYASSAQLYNEIKSLSGKEKEAKIQSYFNLLKSGGNDYPMEQLKKAGVDLTTSKPYLAVCGQFDELVTLLEKEVTQIK
ncbi:MAG: oligoendopeptidase F [bacterium]